MRWDEMKEREGEREINISYAYSVCACVLHLFVDFSYSYSFPPHSKALSKREITSERRIEVMEERRQQSNK